MGRCGCGGVNETLFSGQCRHDVAEPRVGVRSLDGRESEGEGAEGRCGRGDVGEEV